MPLRIEKKESGLESKLKRTGICMIAGLSFSLVGCVSSTLETSQFRPVGAQSQSVYETTSVTSDPLAISAPETPAQELAVVTNETNDPNGVDEAAKQRAIAEMRAKGQQTSGEKTQIGALPGTATEQLTPAQRVEKAAELARKVQAANAEVTENEIESKQASIRRLQQKAKSHYSTALKTIEN